MPWAVVDLRLRKYAVVANLRVVQTGAALERELSAIVK
jgi:hypothetical protein